MLSYAEYLGKLHCPDTRENWKWWKIEICGMSEREAIKASITEYTPLNTPDRHGKKEGI